jgi:uncharacterized protein
MMQWGRWKRWLTRFLGGALLCYVGVIVVLLLLENKLLYHPVRADEDWQPPPNDRVEDIELRTRDGIPLHAWWCPTQKWQPEQGALLYCHGNAGNLSWRTDVIAGWQEALGLAVLIFDYPGYGRSGGKPSESGCYAAANAAYEWLTQVKKVEGERIVIYGGSLGGGVAVDLASRSPHRALVLVKTFTSIPDTAQYLYPWLPARWLVRNRFDSVGKIGACTRPTFIAHGTADSLVPPALSQRLFTAACEPKCFFSLEGADHNGALTPAFFSALRQFLTNTTAEPGAQAAAPPN